MYREAVYGVGKCWASYNRLQVCASTLRIDVGQK